MGKTAERVKQAGLILGGLGVIGFLGIIWLMIYGNLSGNTGIADVTVTILNEFPSWANSTGYTLSGYTANASYGASGFAITSIKNATTNGLGFYNLTVAAANYTVNTLTGVVSNGSAYNLFDNVSINYTYTMNGATERQLEGVIGNQSLGFGTFFGFSNTFFTIAAIVLLIFMLIGLLALVMSIVNKKQGGKSGFSGY